MFFLPDPFPRNNKKKMSREGVCRFSLSHPSLPNGINKTEPISAKNGQLGKIKILICIFFHSVCGGSACFCGLLRQSLRELKEDGTALILKHKKQ